MKESYRECYKTLLRKNKILFKITLKDLTEKMIRNLKRYYYKLYLVKNLTIKPIRSYNDITRFLERSPYKILLRIPQEIL